MFKIRLDLGESGSHFLLLSLEEQYLKGRFMCSYLEENSVMDSHMQKKEAGLLPYSYTKINSNGSKTLNVRAELKQ